MKIYEFNQFEVVTNLKSHGGKQEIVFDTKNLLEIRNSSFWKVM